MANLLKEDISLNWYSKFIEKGDLVFDVGANYGNRTLEFLKLGATVVVVEPQPDCVKHLQNNFSHLDNFSLLEVALGEESGVSEMYCCDVNTISTLSKDWIQLTTETNRFNGLQWNKSIQVEITTMDKVISTYGVPDFCKIDVEGYELEVLKGLSQAIPKLSFEYTKETLPKTIACIEHLNSLGCYKFNLTEGENDSFSMREHVGSFEIITFLSNLQGDLNWGDVYAFLDSESKPIHHLEKKNRKMRVNYITCGTGECDICGEDKNLVVMGDDKSMGICKTCLPNVIDHMKSIADFI